MAPPSLRSSDALASQRPLALLLAACVVYAAWLATQYVAYHAARLDAGYALGPWAYAATSAEVRWWRLGAAGLVLVGLGVLIVARRTRWAPPMGVALLLASVAALVVSLGPVYAPHLGVGWIIRLRRVPALEPLLQQGLWVFGGALSGALVLVLAARPARPARTPSTSHGSAYWSDGHELHGSAGLLIGRLQPSDRVVSGVTSTPRMWGVARPDGTLLRYVGEGHLLTVAPTRTGKGVGCVIPNLLTYPGSVLVTDPKGENYSVTARARRRLGQVVHALDPFAAVGGTAALNPLDLIDAASLDAHDDARLMADMLVVADGKGSSDNAFWNEEARALLTGLILHVAANAPPELRTLTHVRELLTLSPRPFGVLLRDMLDSESAGGLVARAAARLLQKAAKERSGVLSTAHAHTHFLDSPRMARVLGHSTFALADLKAEPTSVYLVLPPDRMDGYRRWLRLMIACGLLATTRTPGQPAVRMLFLLDEFAHLGRIQPVERDVGLVGGYGVTFWLLVQDLAQLRGTYPERWQTFLANCEVLQTFGTNDWETADYLSKMLGETTILVGSDNRSAGVSRGHHGQRQDGVAQTTSERGRRLLLPDEVLRLASTDELLFIRGHAPVRARKLSYLADADFAGLADANPMCTPAPALADHRHAPA